jgi:vitamin B12 transporter
LPEEKFMRNILCGFVLASALMLAQSISGTVTDPQSRAVAGASISLLARDGDARMDTTSDTAGGYRFDRVAAGDYVIQAQAPGFSPFAAANVRVVRDRNLQINLPMQIAAASQQVVVTASSTPQTGDETSKAISVVDNSEIDQRDEAQLSEALRPLPGVRVQQLGGPGSYTTINLRGLPEYDTAILIDGMRFRDAAGTQGDASWFIQDLMVTDVDRVEVLGGSGSSLYGTNAIGGVVNVITDEGGGRTRGSLLAEGGSLGEMRGRANLDGGFRHNRIEYSAGLSELDVTRGIDNDSPVRTLSGQGRVTFHLTPTTQLVARFYGANTFAKVQTGPQLISETASPDIVTAIPLAASQLRLYEMGVPLSELAVGNANFIPSTDDPDSTRVARFLNGALKLEGHPTAKFGYTISYQGLSTTRSFGNGPAGEGYQPPGSTRSDYDGQIHTVDAHVNYQLGFNLLTAGWEFENENYGNYSYAAYDPGSTSWANVTERSNSAYAQDQLRLLQGRLLISASFRAQEFSLQTPLFNPADSSPFQGIAFAAPPPAYTGDGSIAYFFRRTGTKIRAHAGRGYRAPSLYERFGAGFDQNFGYTVYGDPLLRPERSIGLDGGFDQSWWKQRARISATYFYTRLQDTIIFNDTLPPSDPYDRMLGYQNTKGGLARGVELSARASLTRTLDVTAAYTYTNAIERTPIVGNVLRSFLSPYNQVSLVAAQRIGPRLLISADVTAASSYVGEIFGDFANAAMLFPGIKKVDLGASYRIPLSEFRAVRLFAKGSNLLDQNYFESGYRTPGITGMGGVQFEF